LNHEDLLKFAVLAGQTILENGGETYRSEDTITRMLENKVERVETFVTPTGIFASIENDGKIQTTITRVKQRDSDLNKVALVNDLSRRFSRENLDTLDLNKYVKELIEIRSKGKYNYALRIFFAGIAAASSGMLLGSTLKDFLPTFVTATLLQIFVTYFEKLRLSTFIINIIGGAFAALLGIIFSHFSVGTLNGIIIGSIVTLLPGVAITNAVRDAIWGDLVSAVSRGVEAVISAISIAAGVGFILNIWLVIGGNL
jgi:uncharacterized membrane protein YjjP (DUF1212 family)